MCLVKRVQEVRCCFYIRHNGECIINIPLIEGREFTRSRSRFSSSEDMNTLATKGPRGEPIATPSVCSYRAPLNRNSCPFVATLRRSTRSVLVRFKSYVELNQLLHPVMLIFAPYRFKCCNLHDQKHFFLDNGVMTTPKRRILSFVFTVLCLN